MIKSRRRALLKNALKRPSRLPEEYQEVEWLRATGTQWAQTNYYPAYNINKKIGIKGDLTLLNEGICRGTIGTYFDDSGQRAFGVLMLPNIAYFYYGRTPADQHTFNIPEGSFETGSFNIHYEINDFNIIFNDNTYALSSRAGTSNTTPIKIGTMQGQGGTINSQSVLYKTFSIYDSDTLLTDIVPCYRKSDGKPGFYQINVPEGGTNFITNLGSGTDFLIGPDV